MNFIKHLKNLTISAAMVVIDVLGPPKEQKQTKKIEAYEENNDISEEDKQKFIANSIEYNPTTKGILHQYYKLCDEKFGRTAYVTPHVVGILGKRYPLSDMRRAYFTKSKRLKIR